MLTPAGTESTALQFVRYTAVMRCTVDGCPNPLRARGFCSTHWLRWRKHGSPQADRPIQKAGRVCSVSGCTRSLKSRGMCNLHLSRWRRHGDPRWVARPEMDSTLTPAQRFAMYVTPMADGCWLWGGYINSVTGYAEISIDGRRWGAHRLSYELHVGPIPPGLVIDHLCCVRSCVNPAHMETVTVAENSRRGGARRRAHARRN